MPIATVVNKTKPLTWRESIEKAGGVGSAMLWGEPLKSLLADLEAARAKADEADQKLTTARADVKAAHESRAESRELLEVERGAVIYLRSEVETLKAWQARAEVVLKVLHYLRDHEYLELPIAKALTEAKL
jgi:hypothetical protein